MHTEKKPKDLCQWFLHCTNKATTEITHPVLGTVKCCAACRNFAEEEEEGLGDTYDY